MNYKPNLSYISIKDVKTGQVDELDDFDEITPIVEMSFQKVDQFCQEKLNHYLLSLIHKLQDTKWQPNYCLYIDDFLSNLPNLFSIPNLFNCSCLIKNLLLTLINCISNGQYYPSILASPDFFDFLFNTITPYVISFNNQDYNSLLFNLIETFLTDNVPAIEFIIGIGFIEFLISFYDNEPSTISKIFMHIVKNIEFTKCNSIECLQEFILDLIIEQPPPYVIDLISESIRVNFLDSFELMIGLNKNLISFFDLLKVIFDSDSNSHDEFISTFSWSLFNPILPFFLINNEDFDEVLCIHFCKLLNSIIKRSESLTMNCSTEINLPALLLNLIETDISYQLKELILNVLISISKTDLTILFVSFNELITDEFDSNEENESFTSIEYSYDNQNDFGQSSNAKQTGEIDLSDFNHTSNLQQMNLSKCGQSSIQKPQLSLNTNLLSFKPSNFIQFESIEHNSITFNKSLSISPIRSTFNSRFELDTIQHLNQIINPKYEINQHKSLKSNQIELNESSEINLIENDSFELNECNDLKENEYKHEFFLNHQSNLNFNNTYLWLLMEFFDSVSDDNDFVVQIANAFLVIIFYVNRLPKIESNLNEIDSFIFESVLEIISYLIDQLDLMIKNGSNDENNQLLEYLKNQCLKLMKHL